MSTPVYCLTRSDSIAHAAAELGRHGFATMPVVDEDRRIAGLVGEPELIRHAADGPRTTVAGVMARARRTALEGTEVAELREWLLEEGARSIPVLSLRGEVVGIVARRDVMRALSQTASPVAAQVRYRWEDYAGLGRRWDIEDDDGVVTVTGDFRDDDERSAAVALGEIVPGVKTVRTRGRRAVCVHDL